MRYFGLAIFLSLLVGVNLPAQELSGRAGAFADIGLGLRPLGMGGAYAALAADENAARWNPALLGAVRDPVAGFTWTNQFQQVAYHYLAAAYPLKYGFNAGAYVVTAGDDVYRETTIALAAGTRATRIKIPVEGLNLGATVKILLTSFGNNSEADGGADRVTGSSFGYSLDIGAHYRLSENWSSALVLRDLLNGINWDSSTGGGYSEGLPRVMALAAAYEGDKFAFAAEYHPGLYGDTPDRVVAGGEFTLWKLLRPRIGFAQNIGSSDGNRWVTLGMGIEIEAEFIRPIRHVQFGYTHLFHHIDDAPRVGLIISW